ncbi:alpha/beta fold hydrolase [Trinickia caryophylli]|uniref:Polyhydroxyalkanoate synthase n=1 Tax=Trinickia caryophylli TaxID=28094 RepID=A0A1X7H5Y5_TRICW|nr:alpha/beta fold hydrolase [Trinickia caryophylli]PMS09596.1 poly-beta-hydroxybutyrate polymerase [Trinickia caryophylli]TRX17271.1 alpha/beta fold hydrolase [Trinickia caryophylli]WQE11990.1 alpha/beta fold hydrolase [Trinickia caryophylli]SMF79685.1 polyhydroxyalkanoate synthase [Trinickia caryophylli]GLU35617.1 poly-beta-hydroxybutyrate polymerase [Trinickia caryophylli]
MKRDSGQATQPVPAPAPSKRHGKRAGATIQRAAAVTARAACAECAPAAAEPATALDRAAHARVAAATAGLSPASALLAWLDWSMHMAVSPGKAWALASEAVTGTLETLPECIPGWTPAEAHELRSETGPVAPSEPDPRFADAHWQRWPFVAYQRAFGRAEQWWRHASTGVRGVEAHHERLVQFFARQWLDAVAPSNFVATNPRALATAWSTAGANFLFGARNWLEDFAETAAHGAGVSGKPQPAYVPGKDVARTPGKVVFRNALCELLQYAPATPRVGREPVFIVPSWIMKYYILDLQPHDSLVRHLVDAGYTVFMVSWHNPAAHERELSLDDYLKQGLLEALAAVRARCEGERVHAVGYCLGGTLLAIAAAALARDAHRAAGRGHGTDAAHVEPFASITLLAAQVDFSDPGELGLFIDESELAALDALMWEQGYLDGSQMAAAFQLLNARDLIWSRMMSEYLLGRRSKPNDLMSWNEDTTRMPYRMHTEYLTRLFLHNDLSEGRYCVGGRPVALADIETPLFAVGTERDHVSPWRSVYKLHLLTHHPLTFALTSGGHNAGIVSEPGHKGRHYRVATRGAEDQYQSPDAFLAEHAPIEGSWWPCWIDWLGTHTSGATAARGLEPSLYDAPGQYVHER